jgi:SAM-dependent methyltransferase
LPNARPATRSALEREVSIETKALVPDGAHVIHFAPEPIIGKLIKERTRYRTADVRQGRADLMLNIEKLDLADGEADVFIANHVLEHVDDARALPELYRALKPGGVLIATIPIIEGRDASYENAGITDRAARAVHFGRFDHVRQFGRDFRDRIRNAGFELEEFVGDGPDSVRYSLVPGERVFIARKPLST